MAYSTVLNQPEKQRFALSIQNAWGTAWTTQTDFQEFYLTNKPKPDWSGAQRNSVKRTNGKLVKSPTDVHVSEEGSFPTFSIEGIVTNETLHYLFMGAMQDIISEGVDPYQRLHETDGATTGVSGLSPRLFFTAAFYSTESGKNQLLKNCVISNVEFSQGVGENAGLTMFKADLTSYGAADRNASLTPGSWASPGTKYLRWNDITVSTLDGSDIVLESWKLMIANNAVSLGTAEGESVGVRFQSFDVNLEFKAKYDPNTSGGLSKWLSDPSQGSANQNFILEFFTDGEDDYLKIDFNGIHTADPKEDLENAKGVFVDFAMEGVDDGTNEALVVTHTNNVQTQWAA